ncbi:MAG: lysylphosphatidylglycerol synthase domain-containing protein [Candidatus Saccharimonadales bacterium]
MMKPSWRKLIVVAVLFLTSAAFAWYLQRHPEQIRALGTVEWRWLFAIMLSNIAAMAALTALYQVLVRIAGKKIAANENTLLTIYSSIANFFGPLQSGPGVRAAYLKKKHDIPLRRYVQVTLLAYAVYACVSAFCLMVGTRPWWQTVLAVLVAAGVSAGVIRFTSARHSSHTTKLHFSRSLLGWLVVFTALQVVFLTCRYYFALRASGADVSVGQALSYTGAANFALFVSLTPDGIGFREAFLLFAQHIHHVPTNEIVQANIIDRAVYVVFLGLLFLLALGLHAKQKLAVSSRT